MLERLQLRPELAAFELALRDRMARLAAFEDPRFARAHTIERDADGSLVVVSGFVGGIRVCDVLEASDGRAPMGEVGPGLDAALGFLLEILPALSALHSTVKFAHGAISPGRIILTPSAQIVLLDSLYGQALERLQFNRRRLWTELQIAAGPTAGPHRFDYAADVGQAMLTAMMLVHGRALGEHEVPDGLPSLLAEVEDIAQIRGSHAFASALRRTFERTLPLPGDHPAVSAAETAAEVRQLAIEIGEPQCRAALAAFVAEMTRDVDAAFDEESSEPETSTPPSVTPARRPDAVVARTANAPVVIPETPAEPAAAAFAPRAFPPPVVDDPDAMPEVTLTFDDEPTFVASEPAEPEPVVIQSEPDALLEMLATIDAAFAVDRAASPVTEDAPVVVDAPPVPVPELDFSAREPEVVAASWVAEPDVAEAPPVEDVAAPPVEDVAPPAPAASSRRKPKRHGKRGRDKLQSAAAPVPKIVVPPIAAPAPAVRPGGRTGEPLHPDVAPFQPSSPIAAPRPQEAAAGATTTGVRVKAEPPAGYVPTGPRFDRDITALPYVQRGAQEDTTSSFPWKLAAAAVAIMVIGVGAGRIYLSGHKAAAADPVKAVAAPTPAPAPAPAASSGSIEIVTQPAGTRVLLDGKAAGETPLTVDDVAPGRHTLTFVTPTGSLKRVVRIEAGKKLLLDVPVYSGWVAVFAPIPMDISENGRGIGTSEQGRLMLAPGRHQLTLSNREHGYSSVHTVDIEPGEERAVTVQPVGELNANATPWAEVWIDGKKAGDTPIAHLQVPLGTHEIVFKHPQYGERRVTTVVTATAPAAVTADFSKQ